MGLDQPRLNDAGEDVWIDVIQKMDEVYSDLIQSQTELEDKNDALEEADEFIRSVLGAMTDVLIVCDAHGRIQQVNPALVSMTGQSEDVLLGTPFADLFAEEDKDKAGGFLDLLVVGKDVAPCDVGLRVKEGPAAVVALNCRPRHDHRGRLAGMVMVGRPIGELQRAYRELDAAHEQLSQAQQRLLVSEKMAALGRLVAGVAHELNNPISFVFGNMYALKRYGSAIKKYLTASDNHVSRQEMEALRKDLKIDKVLRDIGPLVDGTLEGAERVRDIVEDLRRFSSNQQEAPETFNVVRLMHTAVDWVIKAQRIKPGITFNAPDCLEMTSRKGHVHQIVVNLVQNAADVLSGREDGTIDLSCSSENGTIVIRVADNGTGIAQAEMDKLFEPFFTTKPIGSGTGLGLYVSYNMALKLGGDLQAANRPEGGAEFTLRIPDHVPQTV
ncbi:sensor histidine kinase [Roseibium sp. MMSF_3544]|uniref:sensor histidine kinase n=1 Tax=unclassified Roseibium TaxID=2629323 RepID=UPI00273FB8EC|nr:ATP-binding protein [Roseibium sp. MMSF_3544]